MQKIKNSILKTAMGILLIVVFIQKTEAQEQATAFLKDYYAVSAFGQYTRMKAGIVIKKNPTINYNVLSSTTPQYGLLVNVYQTRHWNFKTGVLLKPQVLTEEFNFTREQTGLDFDYSYQTSLSGDETVWSIPLIAEFVIPINKHIKWMVAPSFSISNYQYFGGSGLTVIDDARMDFIRDDRSDKPLHTSAEISTGFYILFKHFMLQPELRYSKSFNTYKTGSYIANNLTSINTTGTFSISGDNWGFSLNIYVKKRGKNKPRKKKKKKRKKD